MRGVNTVSTRLSGGINRYAYVSGNPVNFNEPSGLFANAVSNRATQAVSYFTMGDFSQTFGATVDAFGGAANRNPALSFAASPAVGVNQGIQSGSVGQVAFEVATADIPGAKAGLTSGALIVGNIIKPGRVGKRLYRLPTRTMPMKSGLI